MEFSASAISIVKGVTNKISYGLNNSFKMRKDHQKSVKKLVCNLKKNTDHFPILKFLFDHLLINFQNWMHFQIELTSVEKSYVISNTLGHIWDFSP